MISPKILAPRSPPVMTVDSSIKIIVKVGKIIIKADSQKTEIETLVDSVEDIRA